VKKRFYVTFTAFLLVLFIFTSCTQLFNKPPEQLKNESELAKDGATGLDIDDIVLKWSATDPEGQTLTYELYVGEGQNPTSWIVQEKNLTKAEYSISGLKPNTTYSWKFVAKDPQGANKESTLFKFTTGKNSYDFITVEYRSGGPEENVDVSFYKMDGTLIKTKKSNSEGIVRLASDEEEIKVVAKKYGRAVSIIEGYRPGFTALKEIPIREARLTPDPEHELNKVLKLDVDLKKLDGTALDLSNVDTNFTVQATLTTNQQAQNIIVSLRTVPGSSLVSQNNLVSSTNLLLGTVSIFGHTGVTPLYVVGLDRNSNRIERIYYLNIKSATYENTSNLYVPEKVGVLALTRRLGLELTGVKELLKNKEIDQIEPLAAPKGSNLAVALVWKGWTSDTGKDQPDGYRLYRSFDGENWELFARVTNTTTSFWDVSAQLVPGKKVWYAVSSVKGNYESEKVVLGDVVPLDAFNFELITPENKSVNVSRNPTFSWKPTKKLTSSEGTVKYYYLPLLVTFVQTDAWLISPFTKNEAGAYVVDEIVDEEGKQIDLKYSDKEWHVYWFSGTNPESYGKYTPILEAGQTYDWTLGYAYAMVKDESDGSIALSIASDFFWSSFYYGKDPWGSMEQDYYNKFTTGNN